MLRGAANFLHLNEQFNIMPGAGQVDPPRYAILVKIDVNKYILVWVVTVVVLFAIVAGIMVGILGRSPTLGAATSTMLC